jgi:hypothetical protein
MLFDLVHHGGVVEGGFVVGKIDGLGLGLQQVDAAAGVVVALLEGLDGGCGLAFEAEGGGDSVPVEFCGGGALGVGSAVWRAFLS